MQIDRTWVTPLTIGAFGLSAVTGILMFFHADSGLNTVAHEWIGWAMVAGVGLHAAVNHTGFKRHLGSGTGRRIIGFFALLLAISFLPVGGDPSGPSKQAPMLALTAAPIDTLAQVARVPTDVMLERLRGAGLSPSSGQQRLADLVAGDHRRQAAILARVLEVHE